MIICGDYRSFDTLLPFSIIVDSAGSITAIGKSIKKLYPSVSIEDSLFQSFSLLQPTLSIERHEPRTLMGEPLLVYHASLPSLRLTGQVFELIKDSGQFLFALTPLTHDLLQPYLLGRSLEPSVSKVHHTSLSIPPFFKQFLFNQQ
jgi:hypothetical protein